MLKIFIIFGLFTWYKVSWQLARYLTRRVMIKHVMRADIAVMLAQATGNQRIVVDNQRSLILPIVVSWLLFAALLYLGATFTVQYLGLTL